MDEKLDNSIRKIRKILATGSGIIVISGLFNLIHLLLLPADLKTALFLGFSSRRLVLIAFLILGILAFSFAFLKVIKSSSKSLNSYANTMTSQKFLAFLVIFFFLSSLMVWITGFSTEHFLGNATYFAMSKRLLPLCIWLLSISIAMIGMSAVFQNSSFAGTPIANKKNWQILTLTFVTAVLLFLFTAWIFPKLSQQLWWSSVPILITQIFVAWTVATFALLIPGSFFRSIPKIFIKQANLLLFLFIWLISAILWVNQPVDFNSEQYLLNPEQQQFIFPRRPNFELYPRFDSETYFNVSESIVTGGGIYRSIDKPFFLAIEGLINWLADGSFEKMLDLQTILLASFPAVIFLLGNKLLNRVAGLFAASLVIIQGLNGIRLMAATKVLVSEPFMQLGTAIIAYIAFLSLKAEGKNQWVKFLILGGAFGLSALIRLNTLVIIPFILLITFIHYAREKRKFLVTAGIFILGIFLASTPWLIHNSNLYKTPFYFVITKVRGVLVNNRYENLNQTIELVDENEEIAKEPLDINEPDESYLSVDYIKPSIPSTILRHFLNNVITSLTILPGSGIPQDLVKGARNYRYWSGFDPRLYKGINPAFFILNLFILSIGISSIIKRHRTAGFIMIAVFFGYHLSNGIALSSGHRYAQPVSWVVLFYYSIGLISISNLIIDLLKYKTDSISSNFKRVENKKNWPISFGLASLCILLLGCTPVLADLLPPMRYPNYDAQHLVSLLDNENNLAYFGEKSNFDSFLDAIDKGEINLMYGRLLTPVYTNNDEYLLLYGKENFGGKGTYLTFNALRQGFHRYRRMYFYPQIDAVNIKNGSDAVLFFDEEKDKKLAIAIGIIDPEFSATLSTYEEVTQIPLSDFYTTKGYLQLISMQGQ